MTDETDNPSLEEVIRTAIRAALGQVHVCLPASVLSYDRTTQKATVQPAIRARYRDVASGALLSYLPPPIPNVPVVWPAATGSSLTMDLVQGDWVTLVVAERSTDEWRSTGRTDNLAQDLRRFDWSDARAVPGGLPFVGAIPPAGVAAGAVVLRGADVRLGDATATDFVALASLVLARLNALEAAFNGHTHVYSPGPGAPVPTATALPQATPSVLADVAATLVKAK
jgi:hypothetical protein